MKYYYYINLEESSMFYADIRNGFDDTVYELFDYSLIEDGFMRHSGDIVGLESYLIDLKILKQTDTLELGE